jgi:hypothetical protein
MRACMAYMHTRTHIDVHPHTQHVSIKHADLIFVVKYKHTYMHTYIHTHTHIHRLLFEQKCIQLYIHTHTHAYTQTGLLFSANMQT